MIDTHVLYVTTRREIWVGLLVSEGERRAPAVLRVRSGSRRRRRRRATANRRLVVVGAREALAALTRRTRTRGGLVGGQHVRHVCIPHIALHNQIRNHGSIGQTHKRGASDKCLDRSKSCIIKWPVAENHILSTRETATYEWVRPVNTYARK